MLSEKLVNYMMIEAQAEEERRGTKIEKIYVIGEKYYFDAWQVQGFPVDYTLVRSDMDEKYKSDMNTEKQFKEKQGVRGGF